MSIVLPNSHLSRASCRLRAYLQKMFRGGNVLIFTQQSDALEYTTTMPSWAHQLSKLLSSRYPCLHPGTNGSAPIKSLNHRSPSLCQYFKIHLSMHEGSFSFSFLFLFMFRQPLLFSLTNASHIKDERSYR